MSCSSFFFFFFACTTICFGTMFRLVFVFLHFLSFSCIQAFFTNYCMVGSCVVFGPSQPPYKPTSYLKWQLMSIDCVHPWYVRGVHKNSPLKPALLTCPEHHNQGAGSLTDVLLQLCSVSCVLQGNAEWTLLCNSPGWSSCNQLVLSLLPCRGVCYLGPPQREGSCCWWKLKLSSYTWLNGSGRLLNGEAVRHTLRLLTQSLFILISVCRGSQLRVSQHSGGEVTWQTLLLMKTQQEQKVKDPRQPDGKWLPPSSGLLVVLFFFIFLFFSPSLLTLLVLCGETMRAGSFLEEEALSEE